MQKAGKKNSFSEPVSALDESDVELSGRPMHSKVATVGIIEDNPGLRRSLVRIISRAQNLKLIGDWPDGESALPALEKLLPQIVLMDINLPGMSGIECTAALKRVSPETQVIIVTVYEDTDSIFRALRVGACGYVLKRAYSAEILEAITEVLNGGAPMTSEIARRLVNAFREPQAEAAVRSELSVREKEILNLVALGFANKEIGGKLNISYLTVRVHLRRIYEKLHVRSRTEALLKYLQEKGFALPSGSVSGSGKTNSGY
jgi:DNA-binding NarL/FixJ family response regulator